MSNYDMIIRGGKVATASDIFDSDIAIKGGRIVAMGHDLGEAERTIDAVGMLLLPGVIGTVLLVRSPFSGSRYFSVS